MKKIIAIILAACLLLALTACGGEKKETVSVSGEKADVNDVALRPDGEADRIYENEGLRLLIPLEYDELLLTETPEKDPDGMLFSVSEKASAAAAKAAGWEPDGAGWIFGIRREDKAAVQEMLCYDMSGIELFAEDADGNCYLYCHPTDVRFVRENNEEMAKDQELWTAYNEWAWNRVRESFLAENSQLKAVTYGNSALEMYLARLAYQPGTVYTVSTTQYGPLAPDAAFDAAPYLERLMTGLTLEPVDAEAPDGEYVVLSLPDEDVRFDFFTAEGAENMIRQVYGDGYERLFKADFADGTTTAAGVMQEWYDALAENADPAAPGTLMGGWSATEDAALTGEAEAAFEKAIAGLLGVDYAPAALLGTQVVAGTNYCILCSAKAVVPEARPYWALMTVCKDLQDSAEIRDITVLDLGDIAENGRIRNAEETGGELAGGWTAAENGALTGEAEAAFEKAAEELLGVNYTPVLLLGTQVVAGTNYSFLARAQTVYPGALPYYTVVTVYENLQGEAEILGIVELDPGALS